MAPVERRADPAFGREHVVAAATRFVAAQEPRISATLEAVAAEQDAVTAAALASAAMRDVPAEPAAVAEQSATSSTLPEVFSATVVDAPAPLTPSPIVEAADRSHDVAGAERAEEELHEAEETQDAEDAAANHASLTASTSAPDELRTEQQDGEPVESLARSADDDSEPSNPFAMLELTVPLPPPSIAAGAVALGGDGSGVGGSRFTGRRRS
jgi:hypothetical protein